MRINNPQNMSGEPLLTGIVTSGAITGDGTPANPLTVDTSGLQFTIDSAITSNGENAVQGGVIYEALEGKAEAEHTHAQSDIDSLENDLASKADSSVVDEIGSAVDELSSAVENKADCDTVDQLGSSVSDLQTAIESKADSSHTHDIQDINGLDSAIEGFITSDAVSGMVSGLDDRISTVENSAVMWDDLDDSLDASSTKPIRNQVVASAINAANGIAGLDSSGKVFSSEIPDLSSTYVATATANSSNGYAKLDADGKVPTSLLPSYVSDVFEGYLISGVFRKTNSSSGEVIEAKSNAIYVDKTTDKTYRWSGSQYTEISKSLALGTTSETAYPGDSGAALASAVSSQGTQIAGKLNVTSGMNANVLVVASGGAAVSDGGVALSSLVTSDVLTSGLASKADLVSGVVPSAQLPIATSDSPGAVIVNSNFGIAKSTAGRLNIVGASADQITNRGGTYAPITPNRLNHAVTAALTDANHLTLTAAQQATAKEVLGIVEAGGLAEIDNATDATAFITAENAGRVFIYTGETDSTWTKGHLYQVVQDTANVPPASISIALVDNYMSTYGSGTFDKTEYTTTYSGKSYPVYACSSFATNASYLLKTSDGYDVIFAQSYNPNFSTITKSWVSTNTGSRYCIRDKDGTPSTEFNATSLSGTWYINKSSANGTATTSETAGTSTSYVATDITPAGSSGSVPDVIVCPTVTALTAACIGENVGKVCLYTGETSNTYTKGHHYLLKSSESLSAASDDSRIAGSYEKNGDTHTYNNEVYEDWANASGTVLYRNTNGYVCLKGTTNWGQYHGTNMNASNAPTISSVADWPGVLSGVSLTFYREMQSDLTATFTYTASGAELVDLDADGTDLTNYYTKTQVDTALSGKANSSHTHTKSDITDFAHTHEMTDITGLSNALNAKQNSITSSNKLSWNLISDQPTIPQVTTSLTENGTNGVQASVLYAELAAIKSRLDALENPPTTGNLKVVYSGTAPSGAQWSYNGGSTWNNFGATVALDPGSYTVTYKSITNYITPDSQSATVSLGQTTEITAGTYTQSGTLQITYSGTAPSGAAWSYNDGSTWNNFGSSVTVPTGNYTITFKDVNGYTTPTQVYNAMGTDLMGNTVTVSAGSTTSRRAQDYTAAQQTFGLSVNYATMQTPPTGAAWSYDGGSTWLEFGASASPTPGTYTITYKPVANYTAPASQTFTAAANDSVVFNEISYTAITYPNAFVVSGLPNNVDQTTAQFNGTYTKTGNAKTYNGVNYPIYYNGVNYLYMSSATSAALSPNDGSSPMMVGRYGIGSVASMSGTGLTGTWTYYSPSSLPEDTYTLTVTESTSTTPEPGTFIDPEDEPTTPTDQYLEISGCATAAMNGKYYFISGDATTAPTMGGTSPRLRHENGHYYIMYYKGGSSSYWCVQNTNAFSYGEPSGSPKYTISSGAGVVSTLFADGVTYGSITTTYVDTTAPVVSNTPWISFAGKTATWAAYNGNYVLYSGDANSTQSVWKHQTKEYYIKLMSGGSSYWGLTNSPSGTTTLVSLSDYNPSAPPAEFTGASTYMGCHIVYHDGTTQPPTGAHLTVWNEYTYTYNDDYYLTSGTASSNNAVWTSVSGNYVIKIRDMASSYLYVWDSTGTNPLQQISGSEPGVATSWGSTVQTYNGYNTKYNAS